MSNEYNEQSIEVLEGLEPVRIRPGMYIGNTSTGGLHHLVYEIVDNSIDEAVAGYCNDIYIGINQDNSITVRDNGRGMPTGIHLKTNKSTVETILTVLHAGGKFNNNTYKTSGGLHGVGASVVNALSSYLKVTIKRDGKIHEQEYKKGTPLYQLKVTGDSKETGTEITFLPDATIFSTTNFNYNTLENRLKELAFLNDGVTITLEDKRVSKEQINVYHTTEGIEGYIKYINQNNITLNNKIIRMRKQLDNYKVDVAFQYINDESETIYTFANNINTHEGGVHLIGFKNALTKAINNFAKENNLIKDDKDKVVGEDVRNGIVAIISVGLSEPQFEGQTKTKLGNEEFKPIVENIVFEELSIYFKENMDYAKLIFDNAQQAKELRIALKKAKDVEKKKKEKTAQGLKGKLADCSSKNPVECEIFLVEGDSAGGSAKQARDRRFQAILAQKGKSMNVEKKKKELVYSSNELMTIANALGTDIGKDFDMSQLNFYKIILMADSDSDGAGHIVPLWLTFFYRYMKQLLTNGHIYIAVPPLYKNVIGNKHPIYTYSEDEQLEFLQQHNNDKIQIQRYKGLGEMNPDQLWETTMNPATRKLIQVSIEDDISSNYTCSLLMGDNVEPRKDFILKNSKFVKNIDI